VGKAPHMGIWNIPQALLIHHSHFFRRKLYKMNVIEPAIIRLPEIEASLFQHFLQWVYFATLPDYSVLNWCEDLELWTLGDDLDSDMFKNAVMDQMYRTRTSVDTTDVFMASEVEWVLTYSGRHSLLTKFVMDTVSVHWISKAGYENDDRWEGLFIRYPALSRTLLLAIAGKCADRTVEPKFKPLKAYLEAVDDEEDE
jgi:hypothetical protein